MGWADAYVPLPTELSSDAWVETIDRTRLTGLGRQTALVEEIRWKSWRIPFNPVIHP
jgi:hypothetical protein